MLTIVTALLLAADSCDTDRLLDIPASAPASVRLSPAGERGTPLLLRGRVLDGEGRGVPGVLLYLYHANADGRYPKRPGLCGAARIQGYLRGYVQTDAAGRYEVRTIRPGAYPVRDTPEHLHVTVFTRRPHRTEHAAYIDDVMFDDDPILDARWRARQELRGGSGIVTPRRGQGDTIVVVRDIHWHRVPGAPRAR